ncbi:MAG: GNAT family N-acetyltransferase [Endozoicomonas sp.]|uniref:GNAT family N-acetyltransferase n=1 Tax=Endozoicomonas sp. TaxID=1892382 RepID=UPI003D9B300E
MTEKTAQITTIWYLAMTSPSELIRKPLPDSGFEVRECSEDLFEYNRFLYEFVGKHWEWTDKLTWTEQQWQDYVESANLRTWVLYKSGSPAGYFELQKKSEDIVELAYFGLAKSFIGQGLGSGFLCKAIEEAWSWGAKKVQVNTCSLDHPSALDNYKARGFKLENTVEKPA